MNPSERLHRAHEAARSGDYDFALREYVWYHDHALELQPSQYGVRLSFALAHWIELGEDYPPAREALVAIATEKAATLVAGEGDRELGHDVIAINEYIGEGRATYELFRTLHHQRPELATAIASEALPAILAAEDFVLARAYTQDLNALVRDAAKFLEFHLRHVAERKRECADQMFEVAITQFVARVQMWSRMLIGVGELAEEARVFALMDDRDRAYFGRDRSADQVGFIDNMRAVFGRSYADEPDVLIEELRGDEGIAEADTLLLTVPNMLGVEYNAHVIESILTHVAPALGWR